MRSRKARAADKSDEEGVLSRLHQAIRAFRDTPGRRGRLVDLQGATEVLVGGDLHGNLDNFRRLVERADLANHPTRHLVVQELVHGPERYRRGGDRSHQLLDALAEVKCRFPLQLHMLLGNHELAQWTAQCIAKDEEGDLTEIFRKGVATAYGQMADEVYTAYQLLFATIPLAIRTPNRVFLCHSIPAWGTVLSFNPAILERNYHKDSDLKPGGPIYSLLWDRDTSPNTVVVFLELVEADLLITGHIPCESGYAVPNNWQLVLDTLEDPACYCLFPTDRPLTQDELVACVQTL
jgi:hypothetical protein